MAFFHVGLIGFSYGFQRDFLGFSWSFLSVFLDFPQGILRVFLEYLGEHRVDVRDDISTVDNQHLRPGGAESNVHHRSVLGDVDMLT